METVFELFTDKVREKLWSYLQGMETLYAIEPGGAKPCFDPTYKGWKLIVPIHMGTTSKRFDPTYKGWKLFLSSYAPNIV